MIDRVWGEHVTESERAELGNRWLLFALSFFVMVSIAGFFLFPSGQANNFPTYLTGLLVLGYVSMHPDVVRATWKSPVFIASVLFTSYLTLTAFWSDTVSGDDLLTVVGAWALIITMLAGIVICAQRFAGFCDLLIALLIVSATGSALHYLMTDSPQPWGRLDTPTIACLTYGLAAIFAICRVVATASWAHRALWSACAVVLLAACNTLGADYVLFGMLTAAVVVGALYAWRSLGSRWFYLLAPLLVALMVAQLSSFNAVLDSERDLIWEPVVDMAYEAGPVFGSGLLSEAKPGLACSAAEDVSGQSSDCYIQHPHNIYIATMYFGGVVGLGLLLLLVVVAFAFTIEARFDKHKPLVLASLAYAFSVLMFDGDRLVQKIGFIWLVFWLPIALAIVLNLRARDDELEEP